MFRTAELQRKLPKEDYLQQVPRLREDLLMMQMELRHAPFPVIVVFAGVDGAGKSETVNKLHEWMDSRWLMARAFGEPSDEERDRPEYWRFWRELPPRGRMGLFLSSWYSMPILDQVYGHTTLAEFDERLERIKTFEKTLADDGASDPEILDAPVQGCAKGAAAQAGEEPAAALADFQARLAALGTLR